MATVLKRRRLANPAGRTRNAGGKRRLTLRQKLHFGTKRQRAAAKASLSRKRSSSGTTTSKRKTARRRNVISRAKHRPRVSNVGEIVAIGLNPGTTRKRRTTKKRRNNLTMATRKRKTTRRRRRTVNAAPARKRVYRRRRRSNPSTVARTRRRAYGRRSPQRRTARRRSSNPGFLSGAGGMFVSGLGVIGGAGLTAGIASRLPAQFNVGFIGYLTSSAIAVMQGTVMGKVLKNKALGDKMTLGGFAYVGLKVLADFAPDLIAGLPIGLRGMGVLTSSSFYSPQVNRPNSMTSFMVPPVVRGAISSAMPMNGMGAIGRGRRIGRMAY